jgi:hypothetical protein
MLTSAPFSRKREAFCAAEMTPRGDHENLYWRGLSASRASGEARPPQTEEKLLIVPPRGGLGEGGGRREILGVVEILGLVRVVSDSVTP